MLMKLFKGQPSVISGDQVDKILRQYNLFITYDYDLSIIDYLTTRINASELGKYFIIVGISTSDNKLCVIRKINDKYVVYKGATNTQIFVYQKPRSNEVLLSGILRR